MSCCISAHVAFNGVPFRWHTECLLYQPTCNVSAVKNENMCKWIICSTELGV